MTRRPAALAVSAVLVAIIGGSIAAVGVILLLLASGGLLELDVAAAAAVLPVVGAGMMVAGIAALGSAVGLWLGRPWAWAASLAVALVSVAGAVVAVGTGGFQLPLLVGLALTVAAAGLLLAPSTRSAAGAV